MNRKETIFLIIFLFLVLTISYISYPSLAIYKNSGSSNAKTTIGTWNVSATSNDSSINLIAGTQTATYNLVVNNVSDVDVIYTIKISNLPNGVQVKLDDGTFVNENNNSITFTDAGQIQYSGITQRTHTLTFNAPLNSDETSNKQIDIDVIFSQKIN